MDTPPKVDIVVETNSGETAEFRAVEVEEAANIISGLLDDEYDDLEHVTIEVDIHDESYSDDIYEYE